MSQDFFIQHPASKSRFCPPSGLHPLSTPGTLRIPHSPPYSLACPPLSVLFQVFTVLSADSCMTIDVRRVYTSESDRSTGTILHGVRPGEGGGAAVLGGACDALAHGAAARELPPARGRRRPRGGAARLGLRPLRQGLPRLAGVCPSLETAHILPMRLLSAVQMEDSAAD